MRNGILLLGSILMAIASPLYADIPGKNEVVLNGRSAAVGPSLTLSPGGQVTGSLLPDTQGLSFLDTHRSWDAIHNDVTRLSGVAPASPTINPSAPVPEPVHYALMGLGLVGLYLARRDRLSAK